MTREEERRLVEGMRHLSRFFGWVESNLVYFPGKEVDAVIHPENARRFVEAWGVIERHLGTVLKEERDGGGAEEGAQHRDPPAGAGRPGDGEDPGGVETERPRDGRGV